MICRTRLRKKLRSTFVCVVIIGSVNERCGCAELRSQGGPIEVTAPPDSGEADAASAVDVDRLPANPRTVSRRKRAAPAKEAIMRTIAATDRMQPTSHICGLFEQMPSPPRQTTKLIRPALGLLLYALLYGRYLTFVFVPYQTVQTRSGMKSRCMRGGFAYSSGCTASVGRRGTGFEPPLSLSSWLLRCRLGSRCMKSVGLLRFQEDHALELDIKLRDPKTEEELDLDVYNIERIRS
eukprot:scaffold1348_cov142-Skeletonema_marinoi.AAC.8